MDLETKTRSWDSFHAKSMFDYLRDNKEYTFNREELEFKFKENNIIFEIRSMLVCCNYCGFKEIVEFKDQNLPIKWKCEVCNKYNKIEKESELLK